MLTLLHKLLAFILSAASFSGFVVLFLIKEKVIFGANIPRLSGIVDLPWAYVIYLIIPVVLAWFSVWLIERFKADDTLSISGNEILPIETSYLPTYVGMYVISLGLPRGLETAVISVFLFLLWLVLGRISFFNPFLFFIGYRYYAVKSTGNKTYTLITREKDLKQAVTITGLIRVNNYTFFKKEL